MLTRVRSRPVVFLFLALGLLLALWSISYLFQPPGKDEGIFLWLGDVVRSGGLQYRDAFETRGPMPAYVTALIETIFGHNTWGLRLTDLVLQYAAVAGIVSLVTRVRGTRISAVAGAALYLLWYANLEFHDTAQPDGWVGIMLLFAVLVLVVGDRLSYPRAFICGVLLGLCILNKPTYGLFVLLPVIGAARGTAQLGDRIGRVAVAALGCVLPVAITVLYFWRRGALVDAIDTHLTYTTRVYARLGQPWGHRALGAVHGLLHQPIVLGLPLALAGLVWLWRRDRVLALLLGWWWGATLANVVLQGQPWLYEWLPTYAPLAVLAALGLNTARRASAAAVRTGGNEQGSTGLVAAAALGLALAVAALNPIMSVAKWAKHVALRTPSEDYQADAFWERGVGWGMAPVSVYAPAQYVKARTSPADYAVFFGQWGANGTYYAQRRNPTRFAMPAVLLFDEDNAFRARYRKEFMADVLAHRPRYIVTDTVACYLPNPPAGWDCRRGAFPEFSEWLSQNYRVDTTLGRLKVWRYAPPSNNRAAAPDSATGQR